MLRTHVVRILLAAMMLSSCTKPEPEAVKSPHDPPRSHADSLKVSQEFFDRGYGEYEPGRLDSALKWMDSAIVYNPENAQAWQVKACCLATLDRFIDSRKAFDTAIRLKPDYRQAWWHRGCLHASTGAVDSALADLQHAIAIDSNVKSWPFEDDCWRDMRTHPKLLAITGR